MRGIVSKAKRRGRLIQQPRVYQCLETLALAFSKRIPRSPIADPKSAPRSEDELLSDCGLQLIRFRRKKPDRHVPMREARFDPVSLVELRPVGHEAEGFSSQLPEERANSQELAAKDDRSRATILRARSRLLGDRSTETTSYSFARKLGSRTIRQSSGCKDGQSKRVEKQVVTLELRRGLQHLDSREHERIAGRQISIPVEELDEEKLVRSAEIECALLPRADPLRGWTAHHRRHPGDSIRADDRDRGNRVDSEYEVGLEQRKIELSKHERLEERTIDLFEVIQSAAFPEVRHFIAEVRVPQVPLRFEVPLQDCGDIFAAHSRVRFTYFSLSGEGPATRFGWHMHVTGSWFHTIP